MLLPSIARKAIASLTLLPACLVAQTPAPAGAGPSLSQTLDYINDGFTNLGAFDYVTKSDRSDTQMKWVGPCGDKTTTTRVESQQVTMSGPDTLVYTLKAASQLSDTECRLVDKKGNLSPIKGDVITPTDFDKKGKKVTNTTSERVDRVVTIPMTTTDPRKIQVLPDTASTWTMSLRDDQPDYYKDNPTGTYTVWARLAGNTSVPLGTFKDKDRADRVAKAYIHVLSMQFKGSGDLF